MSFFSPLLLACLMLGNAMPGDKEAELRAYLEANYAHPEKVMARQFVADATAARLITSVEDKILAKRVLRAYHTKKGTNAGRRQGAGATEYGRSGAVINGIANLVEIEYNDTIGHAERIGGGSGTLTGELTPSGDNDTFHFFMTAPGLLTASVVGDTLSDPNLTIADAVGNVVAFNDDAVGLDPRIDLFLPAGVFYLTVGGFAGDTGTYTFEAVQSAFANPDVPLNTLVNGSLDTVDGTAYRLVLTQDSKVDMTFGGSLDLALEIVLGSGGSFFFIDDVNGLLPAYDSWLPAGVYFLRITEFTGSTGPFTLQVDVTPGMPALPCGSTVTGNVPGIEGPAFYKADLSSAQQIVATTSEPAGNSIGDSILFLFDGNLNFLTSNDDIGGGNFFSRVTQTLPAGTYYYIVIGFGGASGDFDIGGVCTAATPAARAVIGMNAGAVTVPNQPTVFQLVVPTPLALDVAVDTPVGDLDPVLTVFDSNGNKLIFDDDGGPGLDSLGSARFAPGTYTISVRDFGADVGPFELNIRGPLQWNASRVPSGLGDAGDLVALFGAAAPIPPLFILPGLTDGYLLIDPSTLLLLGTTTVGANGTYSLPAVHPLVPVVQALTFQQGGFPATFTNRLPQ